MYNDWPEFIGSVPPLKYPDMPMLILTVIEECYFIVIIIGMSLITPWYSMAHHHTTLLDSTPIKNI